MSAKKPACAHRWVLGTPGPGGASAGQCKLCGVERAFTGGLPEGVAGSHGYGAHVPAPERLPVLRGELL